MIKKDVKRGGYPGLLKKVEKERGGDEENIREWLAVLHFKLETKIYLELDDMEKLPL